ncbi:hypothetical protein SAMN05192550_2899 [Flavobacterium glycines]|uniref:Uncharacterized protein n=2 Tax=Flavobacterium glycines TaxID=551990 RepID=A0A511CGE1_9FLAO|nr:DUF2683 family protein [Flavobacterium glycines]GEL11726.1 hypothetical protein FGL01_24650 [Flavobacterium glycines]SDJ84762.1 hypothetical protein SAMN05192550_2899 [Flavobacterium glycines]
MSVINENDCYYNPDFVKLVEEGREEYKRGECNTISIEDLWE